MAVVNEVITKFSFLGNIRPQEDFNANLGASIGLLTGFAATVKLTTAALYTFVAVQLNALAPMVQLREETGMAAEEIERLGFLATAAGGNVEGMNGTLRNLTSLIGDAALNGNDTLARLGINVRNANGELRKADDILMDVQRRFSQMNLSRAEQLNFASALGIDSSLIKFLNLSTAEYREFNKQAENALALTDEQVDSVDKYNRSMGLLQLSLNGVKNQIAVGFAPQLTALSEWFTKLLADNREWIIKGIAKTGEFLFALSGMITRLIPVIAAFAAIMVVAKVASLGFGAVLGAIFSPVILITALIVGVILVIDDLIVAFQGGQSAIRSFIQEWFGIDITPILQEMVAMVLWAVDEIIEIFTPLAEFFGNIFGAIGKVLVGDFTGALDEVQAALVKFGEFATRFMGRVFSDLGMLALKILPDWAVNLLQSTASVVGDGVGAVSGFFGGETTMPFSPVTPAGGNRSVTQTNTINVVSSDPDRAGRIAADRLQDQLATADAVAFRGGF